MSQEDIGMRFAIMIDLHAGAKALGFAKISQEVWRSSLRTPIAELERWRREQWTKAGWRLLA